jgi:acetyltransferase-like isoleucine patch superfamily enzyme
MQSYEYCKQFKECGTGVVIEPGVWIEHPESWIVGDGVKIRRGVLAQGKLQEVRLADGVHLYPNVFIQGTGTLRLGEKVILYPNNYLSVGSENGLIEIGAYSHFAPGCAMYGAHKLVVGEYCAIAANSVLATLGHNARTTGFLAKSSTGAPITLERDVWIGANATVLPGVHIAHGCVIGAGAVLTANTKPYGVYLGVPARRQRDRQAITEENS